MYLLDSNHCSYILEQEPSVARRMRGLDRASVSTCIVVRGELLFMARRSERPASNLAAVLALLRDLTVWPLDEQTSDVYAEVKNDLLDRFGPRERARRRQFDLAKLGLKDNDLWIAATAKRHGLTVVSTDHDFRRIADVITLDIESWFAPDGGAARPPTENGV